MYNLLKKLLRIGIFILFVLFVSDLLAPIFSVRGQESSTECEWGYELGDDNVCYRVLNEFGQFDPEEVDICFHYTSDTTEDENGNAYEWYESTTVYAIDLNFYLEYNPGSYAGVCLEDVVTPVPEVTEQPEDVLVPPADNFDLSQRICRVDRIEGKLFLICELY